MVDSGPVPPMRPSIFIRFHAKTQSLRKDARGFLAGLASSLRLCVKYYCCVVVLRVTSPMSYSGLGTPMIHLSNQPTMCCSRSMRCHGCPERDNSCDSFGKGTITVGIRRYFNARNIASPPGPVGVRQSTSPRININGVWILLTYVIGERRL